MFDELKPCPFCGSRAYLYADSGICVVCPTCGARSKALCDAMTLNGMAGNATEAVIKAWNRRVTDEGKEAIGNS